MGGVQRSKRLAGELHGDIRARRAAGGFVATEGNYPPGLRIGRHDHELASVSVVMAGCYDEDFGRRSRRAEPGFVIIHPEGEHHAEVHDAVPVRLLTIEIGCDRLQALRPEVRIFDEAWHRRDYVVAGLARRLSFEIAREDATGSLGVESAVLDLLAALDRAHRSKSDPGSWVDRVRDRLEDEPDTTPSMAELARLAGRHPVHLARAFRRRFGCSIGAYVRRLRVGRAMVLLEDGALDLSTVAYDAGFADQSHMTRLVRAQTGLTPGAWRRRAHLSS